MTIGEKIHFYREMRGMSQSELANCSQVPLSTLRKYEIGNRHPKLDQLQKIANGLHISLHALIDINIDTIDDIAPYLFAIAKAGNITFHGTKDENDKYIGEDLTFSFNSPILKHFMKEWADKKEIIDKLRLDAQNTPDVQARKYLLNRADEIEREIEMRMVDSQLSLNNKNDN